MSENRIGGTPPLRPHSSPEGGGPPAPAALAEPSSAAPVDSVDGVDDQGGYTPMFTDGRGAAGADVYQAYGHPSPSPIIDDDDPRPPPIDDERRPGPSPSPIIDDDDPPLPPENSPDDC